MTTNRPLRVFLCHSSNDKPAVRALYEKLRAEPWIEPWLDEEELYPGQDWNLEIEKAIEETDVILVCLSNNSITKEGYVQREIRIALDYADYKPEGTLFIIPVRLEECTPPKRLARWQYADYFEGQRERGLERLLVSLNRRTDSLGLKIEKPLPKEQKTYQEEESIVRFEIPASATEKSNSSAWMKYGNEELNQAKDDLNRGDIANALNRYNELIKKDMYLNNVILHLEEASYRYPKEVGIWQALGDAYISVNRLQDGLDAANKVEELLR